MSLRESGIPERRYPGFWDNDGRCCGTAGVGDVILNVWQRHGHDDDPLLLPGVGWMQGAAGIAAYLFRVARVLEEGRDADGVARMDTWWALPAR